MLKDILAVPDPRDHKRVAIVLFKYLFRAINKFEYRKQIGDKDLAKQVWSRVVNNGYVIRNCKLFSYAVHYNRGRNLPTSPAKYEIMQDDVGLLRSLDLSHIPEIYKPYSLFDFKNFETSILGSKELQTNIGKFVSKKLIFLDRHFDLPRSDIQQTLNEAAIYALRKQYPYYKSDLHALNVCKTAIKNRGHGLIEYHTRFKRNELLNEKGVFQAVNVSFDSGLEEVTALSVMPVHDDPLRQNLEALSDLMTKMGPKARSFLAAASGVYDAGFTMYLGVDNSEAVHDWTYERYMGLLRAYHLITEQQAARLLLKIRKSIV